ncbi:MAG: hypothetical protein U0610_17780 [bacterium]
MVQNVDNPAVEAADEEIGKRHRQRLRRGAIALIVATFVPSSGGQVMWIHMYKLTMYATAFSPPRMSPEYKMNLLFLFSACSWTIVFAGWLGFRMSRNPDSLTTPPSDALLRFARRLFLGTLYPPCVFVSLYTWRFRTLPLLAVLAGIPAYLLLGRWLHQCALRRAGTAFQVLWLALLPFGVSMLGWTSIGSIFLFSPGPIFAHVIVLGFGGTLAMLLGLNGWWRVLREHGAVIAPSPAAPNPG